ncbi:MAG: hypothetical protein FWD86_00190 [Firmicutes bacterium]|nr:hypothetical protein [Bacillota bacterium]
MKKKTMILVFALAFVFASAVFVGCEKIVPPCPPTLKWVREVQTQSLINFVSFFFDQEDYLPDEWALVIYHKTKGLENIQLATTATAVIQAAKNAKTSIDEVERFASLSPLDQRKATTRANFRYFASILDEQYYTKGDWDEIESIIADANIALNNAYSVTGVDTILKDTSLAISAIRRKESAEMPHILSHFDLIDPKEIWDGSFDGINFSDSHVSLGVRMTFRATVDEEEFPDLILSHFGFLDTWPRVALRMAENLSKEELEVFLNGRTPFYVGVFVGMFQLWTQCPLGHPDFLPHAAIETENCPMVLTMLIRHLESLDFVKSVRPAIFIYFGL